MNPLIIWESFFCPFVGSNPKIIKPDCLSARIVDSTLRCRECRCTYTPRTPLKLQMLTPYSSQERRTEMAHGKDKQMHFIEGIELSYTSDISSRAINSRKYYPQHQFSIWSRVRLHAVRLTFRRFATMGGVEFNARPIERATARATNSCGLP